MRRFLRVSFALTALVAATGLSEAQPANYIVDTPASPYHTVNAYAFAVISDAAYLDDHTERRAILGSLGFEEAGFISVTNKDENTQVVFAEAPGIFVVAPRGTQEKDDKIT